MPAEPPQTTIISKPQARVLVHMTYLEVAVHALERARHAAMLEHKALQCMGRAQHSNATSERASHHYSKQMAEAAMTAVVFAAFTLEAYMNGVSAVELSKRLFETVDRLNLPGKCVIVPALISSDKGLGFEDDIVGRVAKLQKLRNELAHPYCRFSRPKSGFGGRHSRGIATVLRLRRQRELFAYASKLLRCYSPIYPLRVGPHLRGCSQACFCARTQKPRADLSATAYRSQSMVDPLRDGSLTARNCLDVDLIH